MKQLRWRQFRSSVRCASVHAQIFMHFLLCIVLWSLQNLWIVDDKPLTVDTELLYFQEGLEMCRLKLWSLVRNDDLEYFFRLNNPRRSLVMISAVNCWKFDFRPLADVANNSCTKTTMVEVSRMAPWHWSQSASVAHLVAVAPVIAVLPGWLQM